MIMNENAIQVHAVIKCKYKNKNTPPKALREHFHDFYQLVYIVAGGGIISIDGKDTQAKEGEVFFLKPYVSHSFYCKTGAMTTYELKFDILSPDLETIMENYPVKVADETNAVRDILLSVISEGNNKRSYYEPVITLYVTQMIYILARKGECLSKRQKPGKKPVFEDTGKEPTAIEKAKRYIEENYLEKITLHDLAVRFMLSEAHLCREFTKKFHMSPIKYINFLRLERAKELLAATEMTITEVSEAAGFNGIHYFSRYFTKMEKLTPYEYRAALRDGFIIRFDT